MIASSQGDGTFHVFDRVGGFTLFTGSRHLGRFAVDGVADADGLQIVNVPVGRSFPAGLLVVHNGEAPEPPDTSDINSFEYDGSTQLKLVDFP